MDSSLIHKAQVNRWPARGISATVVVGGVVAIGAVACQTVLAIDGDVTVASHVVEACGVSLPAGACQACVASKCCAELGACAGNAGCKPYETCLLGCGGDYACRAKCQAAYPIAAGPDVPTVDRCVAAECETECGVTCGTPGAFVGGDAAVGCQECLVARVCGTVEACGRNLDCAELTRCVDGCVVPDCLFTCLDAHEAGVPLFTPVLIQAGTACHAACALGSNWECVGKVTWQFATSATSTMVLNLVDAGTLNAIAGSTVRACRRDDVSCSSPLATAVADAKGRAALTMAAAGIGFQGYFEITTPDYTPTLYFLAYPLTEPHGEATVALSKPSTMMSSAALVGVTLDPSRGTVAVFARDCFFALGGQDVVVTADGIDDKTAERYFTGNGYSATATQTDGSGFVVFFNAPITNVTVHAKPIVTGVESSKVTVFVRAGTTSYIEAFPTPR